MISQPNESTYTIGCVTVSHVERSGYTCAIWCHGDEQSSWRINHMGNQGSLASVLPRAGCNSPCGKNREIPRKVRRARAVNEGQSESFLFRLHSLINFGLISDNS